MNWCEIINFNKIFPNDKMFKNLFLSICDKMTECVD